MTGWTSDDPLRAGLRQFSDGLRAGRYRATEVIADLIHRTRQADETRHAFVYLDDEAALAAARAIDSRLARGEDPGPLAGIPVAVKDLVAVDGMPPARAGSRIDVADLIGEEGAFVQRLRGKGCVLVGKTRTTEFAAGAHNITHRMPRNPVDSKVDRSPAGSSSGSAVAVAGGMTGFAVGSDTGGSIRVPAAFCGVCGLKTSRGLWPLDGVFPLSPHLDTLGLLTAQADDAAFVFAGLQGEPELPIPELKRLTIGYEQFADDILCREVEHAYDHALRALANGGVNLVPVSTWTEERATVERLFGRLVAGDLRRALGETRLARDWGQLDPVVRERLMGATDIDQTEVDELIGELERLRMKARQRMNGLDAIVGPTSGIQSPPLAMLGEVGSAVQFVGRSLALSRVTNVQDYCAISLPIASTDNSLPVGFQIAAAPWHDARLLAIARSIEGQFQERGLEFRAGI